METKLYTLPTNLPSVDEFAERFPQYGNTARNEGRFLYDLIVTPECFNIARVVTLNLELPAVAGIADICYQAVMEQEDLEWRGFVKQFIGAVVCKLMEANGFEKTGSKRSIPHPEFTKGEVYKNENNNESNI